LASLSIDEAQNIKNISKPDVLKALRRNKSLLAGRDLGKYVTVIPQVYEELIQKAVELSTNAK
jgi:putative ATP-dependent endonuclease of the OLD family